MVFDMSVNIDSELIDNELPAVVDGEILANQRRRGMFFVSLAVAGVGFALTLQIALNANFAVQEMNLDGYHQGILEAFRESCGIFAFILLALLAGLAEPIIGAIVLVFLAVGLGSYCFVPAPVSPWMEHFPWLVVASMVWSQGLHIWMPLPNSMTLAMSEPGRAGRNLGVVSAAGAAGSAVGLAVAITLTYFHWLPIRPLYIVAGAAALVAAVACIGIPRGIKVPGNKLVFRWKYWLFYMMNFLEGWRKQIFMAFAGYFLVKKYGTPLETMLLLYLIIQCISWVISPFVGRLIDRIGERKILVFYYASLTFVFVGYSQIQHAYLLYALFILDSAFFACTMAMTTYVNRIAPPCDHTATLSMGVAINHVAAVAMPFVGAWIWEHYGYQWVFYLGVIGAAASVGLVLLLPRHKPAI
ncbi:MAG: MFS transporter [Planctomycetaceae bacterium]|nr:MAG: MFS transporter [Planctomycetaceae bacterium]